ncbi:MAG: alpha/beta hydrolase fold protein, partial [Acidimicrobiales bacterium]|nr:alpha/beta hydrolase fold protein [Acidimicrobiales bacterium]
MEATRPGLPPGLHVVRSIPEGSIGEPVVVLVHGAMDRSSSFGRVARRLGDLPLVRYDRRGYGRSAGLPAGTLDDQVDDLVAVIESATAEAAEAAGRSGDDALPAVVVGHSIGGVIALVAAARRPDLISSVAAFEAPMSWAPWWPSSSPGGDAIAAAQSDPARFVAEDAAPAPVEASEVAATEADPARERSMTPDPAGDAVDHFMRRMIGDSRWERLPAATRLQRRAEGHAL